jgi:membrane-associated phospholipid phosphatase
MNQFVQTISSIDVRIYYFLGHFAGNRTLGRLASHEEGNNLLKGGIVFAMYWYLWFRVSPDRDRRRKAIIAIAIGAILAIIVARTFAFIAPFRLRPINDPTLAHPSYAFPMRANLEEWSSFPSDTAAYFFALAFGLAYLLRRIAVPIMLYTAVWICLPRMFLGFHYASDIVVGGAIGISMVWLSLRSGLLQLIVAPRALAAMETSPEWFYAIAFFVSFEMATVFEGLRDVGRGALNSALFALHLPRGHSPIYEWGGLLAMAGILLVTAFVMHVLRHKFRHERVIHNGKH